MTQKTRQPTKKQGVPGGYSGKGRGLKGHPPPPPPKKIRSSVEGNEKCGDPREQRVKIKRGGKKGLTPQRDSHIIETRSLGRSEDVPRSFETNQRRASEANQKKENVTDKGKTPQRKQQ